MARGLLRVLALLGLSGAFGTAVWILQTGPLNSQTLLAQVTRPGTFAPLSQQAKSVPDPKNAAEDTANARCAEGEKYVYDSSVLTGVNVCPGSLNNCKKNLYGLDCRYVRDNLVVTGACVSAKKCAGKKYVNQEGKFCDFGSGNCQSGGAKGQEAFKLYKQLVEEEQRAYSGESNPLFGPEGSYLQNVAFREQDLSKVWPASASGNGEPGVTSGNVSTKTGVGSVRSGGPTGGQAGEAIGIIANSQTGRQGVIGGAGKTIGGPINPGSFSSFGGLFGGTSPGGGGGYAPSGGTIAYVPVNQYSALTSPNFDASGRITFPEPQPSPSDILAYLSENSKRQGRKLTAEDLADRGVVDSIVRTVLQNVAMPIESFMQSVFTDGEASETVEKEQGSTMVREDLPPLARGRLVLTLAAGDSLVAGDPSVVATGYSDEVLDSIPESNRAWVQSATQAGDEIEGIASTEPSYGWGEVGEEGGGAGAEAPEVSDVTYEPFVTPGSILPSVGVDTGEAERPQSFFSVIGKSFETIGKAVSSLFSNIGKSLFWWL